MLIVPFFQLVPMLLAYPIFHFWSDIQSDGELVATGFLWISFRKFWVWLVFFAYYFLICFLPLSLISLADAYTSTRTGRPLI